ncbi:hypothetical protein M422DRAFT_43043 [Sphaerobolus stellatus SS14]|nr:hypothetical protein M422DRAFT_43043 [Sphaerobolus stellatus SS14]
MDRSLQMLQGIDTDIFDCGPDNDWEDVPMSAGDQLADLELSHEGMELEGYLESIGKCHRLNVEIKCLVTWIEDEMELFLGTLEKCIETDPLLYKTMKDRTFRQERINN